MSNTGPKTPPPGSDPVIKSTPNAAGTAVISDNIHTLGTNVDDLRQWIKRDIQDNRKCGIDDMLQELLYRCSDSKTDSKDESKQKETLLKNVLDDVLGICDDTMKKEMKEHLSCFVKCKTEPTSYEPFVRAANCALHKLGQLKARGIIPPNGDDDNDKNIMFHHNDTPIKQSHQGVESQREPDVVVVSHATARHVLEEGAKHSKHKPLTTNPTREVLFSDFACKKPLGRFQWTDVLSYFEFKRLPGHNMKSPNYDDLNVSDAPTPQQHMLYGGKIVQSAGSTPAMVSTQSTSKEVGRSAGLMSSNGEKKRRSDNQGSNERSGKKVKSNHENGNNGDRDTEKMTKKVDPLEQNGLYAAEMFAAHVARQHVLSCIVINDMIYIWYFDRQDAIQSAGFNFIHDLPRFLVLLLIMQRLPYAEWGHNPLFGPECGFSGKIDVWDEEKKMAIDLEFDFRSPERTTHYGLRGRATNVFPVKSEALSNLAKELAEKRPGRNGTEELVAKIYWPEETRQSEADILKMVHEIAAKHPEVKDHVPDVIWSHKFADTSTTKIREALGIDFAEVGGRALYIIVFRKLRPITALSGDEFLRAWWHALACHRVLWEWGVRHRDISPSNLMFYRDSRGEVVGVLNDYDLSSTNTAPSGRERTGTVPFMAIDLLSPEAMSGNVEHLYQHDAESFIWVLTWVCLRYQDGVLLRHGRPLDSWLTVNALGCQEKKTNFNSVGRHSVKPTSSHESNWPIAQSCLKIVYVHYGEPRLALKVEDVFNTWFADVVPSRIKSM